MSEPIDISAVLGPIEQATAEGTWVTLRHPITREALGEVRVRPLSALDVQIAIHQRQTAGDDAINATRRALAEVAVVEARGITIRGEWVGDKRHLLAEMVSQYEPIYTQVLAHANDAENYASGEPLPPSTAHDATDGRQDEA